MVDAQGGLPRTGLALRDALAWHDFCQIVESAEQTGYEAVFVPEITGREAFTTLTGLAAVSSRMLLGTGVVPMGSREPQLTAMAAATVHELSGGRMVVGIGTGGAGGPGALDWLRAYVGIVRGALSGDRVNLPGGGSFQLTVPPSPNPPPVWISALGPRAMRLAGEIADGVLLNWCPPERVAFALDRIRDGAGAAGRDPGTLTVAVYVRACVGQEEQAAMPVLQAATGQYASYPAYRRQFAAVGLGSEAEAGAAAHRAGRPGDVPEALVRAVTLLGDGAAAAAALQAYRDAGADLPIVYPVPCLEPVSSIMGTLFALAPVPTMER